MSVTNCGSPGCSLCTALPRSMSVTTTGPITTGRLPSPTIFDLVKADLDERDRIGAAQHGGRPLRPSVCTGCGHPYLDHYDSEHGQSTDCIALGRDEKFNLVCQCQAYGGRDFLREAYEGALDLAIYLRGALAEREAKK